MRTTERTTICLVLTIVPFVGIGCMLNRSGPPKLTRKEPKIFAVQRDKPLSAQADTNKQISPSDESEKTEVPSATPKVASVDQSSSLSPLPEADRKSGSVKTATKVKKPETEPAVAATSSEPKREWKIAATTKTASEFSSEKNVVFAQDSIVSEAQNSDVSEKSREPSQIQLAGHVESTECETEEIEFEIPKPVSSPSMNQEVPQRAWDAPDDDEIEASFQSSTPTKADQWNAPDSFEFQVEKTEERDFQQVCLVKFKEERVFTPGLPELTVEYRAQNYRFSSVEAAEKFRAGPERFVPTAGGLDVVSFRNNQEVIQGSLDFAVWYNQRLFLFSNNENIATFQRQPEKFSETR